MNFRILLVCVLGFCFSSCARDQHRYVSFVDLPELPAVSSVEPAQKMSGKLIVESFRDYRGLKTGTPQADDCSQIMLRILYTPAGKVSCKHESIGLFDMKDSPKQKEMVIYSVPKSIAEYLDKRKLFDEVEYVRDSKEDYPDASWRLVGLIIKADESIIYNGYYLPLVNSYMFTLGTSLAKILYDVEIEFKLEDLKNKKTVLQKKYSRSEISEGLSMYELDYGAKGWNVGAYQFSKTARLLFEDFLKDIKESK